MWDELTRLLPGFEWQLILVYARVQAFIIAVPGFGERAISARVKVSLAMAIAPLLAQSVASLPFPSSNLDIVKQVAGEMIIGLGVAMMMRIITMSLDIATSAIAATSSLSQIVGVPNEFAPHPIGNLLHLAGIAILMALGLPVMLIDLMLDTLIFWPPAGFPKASSFVPEAGRVVGYTFSLAMILAAPFTLGGLLFQALCGVINRAMPNLPVVFIAAPLAIFLALVGLVLLSPTIINVWAGSVLSFEIGR